MTKQLEECDLDPCLLPSKTGYSHKIYGSAVQKKEEEWLSFIQPHRLPYNQVVVNVHINFYYICSFTRLVPGDPKALYLKEKKTKLVFFNAPIHLWKSAICDVIKGTDTFSRSDIKDITPLSDTTSRPHFGLPS